MSCKYHYLAMKDHANNCKVLAFERSRKRDRYLEKYEGAYIPEHNEIRQIIKNDWYVSRPKENVEGVHQVLPVMTENEIIDFSKSVYDGGWRSTDRDELIDEYGLDEGDAKTICERLQTYEATMPIEYTAAVLSGTFRLDRMRMTDDEIAVLVAYEKDKHHDYTVLSQTFETEKEAKEQLQQWQDRCVIRRTQTQLEIEIFWLELQKIKRDESGHIIETMVVEDFFPTFNFYIGGTHESSTT